MTIDNPTTIPWPNDALKAEVSKSSEVDKNSSIDRLAQLLKETDTGDFNRRAITWAINENIAIDRLNTNRLQQIKDPKNPSLIFQEKGIGDYIAECQLQLHRDATMEGTDPNIFLDLYDQTNQIIMQGKENGIDTKTLFTQAKLKNEK